VEGSLHELGKKTEHPEITHDFRQSVDRLFSRDAAARIDLRGETAVWIIPVSNRPFAEQKYKITDMK
jgi:hypothetical protein